jgi:hypothetical protein
VLVLVLRGGADVLVGVGGGTGVSVLAGGTTGVSVLAGGTTGVSVLAGGGTLVDVLTTFVGIDVSGGLGVFVAVDGAGVLVRVGWSPPTGVGVNVVGCGVSVGVGAIATNVAEGSIEGTVPITGVSLGPSMAERGVTVGWDVISALPGVVVGAFCAAAITITSLVGTLAITNGVGLSRACAAAVARSAA